MAGFKIWRGLAALAVAATAFTTTGAKAAPEPLSDTDGWLKVMNHYRAASGVPPVVEDASWTNGIKKHFEYLRLTPRELRTGQWANVHTENPESPYYSEEGKAAAESIDFAGYVTSERAAIEAWLTAPFHAIGIVRNSLVSSAFFKDAGGMAGLDVIRGMTGTRNTAPVLFPGRGSTVTMAKSGREYPNPLESCGYESSGLILFALLPAKPVDGTTAKLSAGGSELESCMITATTFKTTDTIYGPTGKYILSADRAVLIVPKLALTARTYTATISQPGLDKIEWSFTANPPPAAAASSAQATTTTAAAASGTTSKSGSGGESTTTTTERTSAVAKSTSGIGFDGDPIGAAPTDRPISNTATKARSASRNDDTETAAKRVTRSTGADQGPPIVGTVAALFAVAAAGAVVRQRRRAGTTG